MSGHTGDTRVSELEKILTEMESVLVAFSGGVDSTFLLKVARDTLGDRAGAVLVASEIHPEREAREARELAGMLRADLDVIEARALDIPGVWENGPERCYHCKMDIFRRVKAMAVRKGFRWVADGSNADDAADYRPGRKAVQELAVRSPLAEAGLTKKEIRALSKELGLPTWSKPSMACLASRVPYHEELSEEVLRRIDDSEELLRELGFAQVRVRVRGPGARIEVPPGDIDRLTAPEMRAHVASRLKGLGFAYVTVDLEGYRSGSMNEVLDDRDRD